MEKIILFIIVCFLFTGCINDYAYVNNLPTAPVFDNKKRVEAYGSMGVAHAQGSLSVRPYKNTGICLNAFSGFQGQSYLEGGLVQKFKIKNNSYFHLGGGFGRGCADNFLGHRFFAPLIPLSEVRTASNYSQLYIQPYFSIAPVQNRESPAKYWTFGVKLNRINFENYDVSYHRFSGNSSYNYTIAYSFTSLNTWSVQPFINFTKSLRKLIFIQCNVSYNFLNRVRAIDSKAISDNPYGNPKEIDRINHHPFSNRLTFGLSIGLIK